MEAGKKQIILLVDDDEFYLDTAEAILKEKYNIVTAKSGKEAISCLFKGTVPNLILLDIMMPRMDGWKTYSRLKGISLLKEVPILFVTALYEASDMKHAFDIGAADYITKPYRKNDLLDRIEKTIIKRAGELRSEP